MQLADLECFSRTFLQWRNFPRRAKSIFHRRRNIGVSEGDNVFLLVKSFHVQLAILHLLTTPFKIIIMLIFHFAKDDRHTWKRKSAERERNKKKCLLQRPGVVTFPHKTVLCSSFCALTSRRVNIFRRSAYFDLTLMNHRPLPRFLWSDGNLLKIPSYLLVVLWMKAKPISVKLMMRTRAPLFDASSLLKSLLIAGEKSSHYYTWI